MQHGRNSRLTIAALLLAGCGAGGAGGVDGGAPAPDAATSEGDAAVVESDAAPTLPIEIGTGATSFVSLDQGQEADIVAGPQGGYHIWTSVRIHDVIDTVALVAFSARFEEDDSLVGPPTTLSKELSPGPDETKEVFGLTNFVIDPEATRGRRVTLRIEVFPPDGRRGLDECTVVAR